MTDQAPDRYRNPDDAIAYERVVADTFFGPGPLLFWGALLSNQGTGGGAVDVWDGSNALGRRFGQLRIATDQPYASLVLQKPVLFRNGLFVDLTGTNAEVTVLFEPLRLP